MISKKGLYTLLFGQAILLFVLLISYWNTDIFLGFYIYYFLFTIFCIASLYFLERRSLQKNRTNSENDSSFRLTKSPKLNLVIRIVFSLLAIASVIIIFSY